MFTPNHVVVTVVSARNLPSKGKTGKVDAFVVIQLNETKFQTSIKHKTLAPIWEEECEFFLPNKYSVLILLCYHRTFLGLDEFLGQVRLPLDEMFDSNEKPRNRWYPLKGKSGKKGEHKYRGEIEIRLEFAHKPAPLIVSSENNANQRKNSNSGDKQSSLSDIRAAVKNALSGHHRKDSSSEQKESDTKGLKSFSSFPSFTNNKSATLPAPSTVGPKSSSYGYDSDKETSDKSSFPQRDTSFNNLASVSEIRPSLEPLAECDDNKSGEESDHPIEPLNYNKTRKNVMHSFPSRLSNGNESKLKAYSSAVNVAGVDLIYETMTKPDLIEIVNEQRIQMGRQERRIRELEDYIDQLVLRVMNSQPDLLQGPFFVQKTKWKF